MSRFRNALCHASGMQFVTLRNAVCHAQECSLSRSGMQFVTLRNVPESCIHLRKFIFLSAVAALAVSCHDVKMAKVVMEAEKELEPGAKTEKTERKCSFDAVKSASRTMSTRESSSA